ncbi:MAG: cupin domain-containing protein [Bifidobacterium bifidum]
MADENEQQSACEAGRDEQHCSAVSAGPRPRQPQRTLRPLSSRPPTIARASTTAPREAGEGEAHHCKCKHGDAEESGDEQPKHCACKHDAEGHAISTEPHLGYVADIASLIEIQQESTVSRVVMREDGLRVVLFGFDKDQALSEHTAAMPVTIQVLEGKLRVGGEGREVELVPGGVVYLSARLPHTVYAVEPSKMLLSMFDNRG